MRARRWPVIGVIVVALLLLVGRAVAGVFAGAEWYRAADALPLWRERAGAIVLLQGGSGALATLFLLANFYAVRRSIVSLVLPRRVGGLEIGAELPGRYLTAAAVVLALVLGAMLTLPADVWRSLVLVRHGIPFGESDPYFDADLGFFVYWLPLERALYAWALVATLVAVVVVVFLYALTPSLRWERTRFHVSNYVRRHIVVLGCLLMLLLAWSFRLEAYGLLLHGTGVDGMFSFTDRQAGVPADLALALLMAGFSIVVFLFGWTGQVRGAFAALTLALVLIFGLRVLAPLIVANGGAGDASDPGARDRPYIGIRADFSRRAYAVDRIVPATPGDSLAYARISQAAFAAPAWDEQVLVRAIPRQRDGEFEAAAVGWFPDDGRLSAAIVERPRTAGVGDSAALGGWRVTRVSAADADSHGNPVRLASGGAAPPRQRLAPVLISRSAHGYTVAADPTGHLVGPALTTVWARLANAWSLQNVHLLVSDLPQPLPRLITKRSVASRVAAVAPFFVQGTTAAPVVVADTLFWAVDLYTGSDTYPLSEHLRIAKRRYSYFQHAATAIVNATTGRVLIAADSSLDPVAQSWAQLFPELFAARAALRPALRQSLPPAVDAARAQGEILARYGADDSLPPYGTLPASAGADSLFAGQPPSLSLSPTTRELLWVEPVLDASGRLSGAIAAVGGSTASVRWIPIPGRATRWTTIVGRLRSALDSATVPPDARLVRGPIRLVPVGGSVALVEAAYAWRAAGIPTLLRVGVLADSTVRTGATLAAAVGVAPVASPADTTPATLASVRARITVILAAMRTALTHEDWAAFGRAFHALRALAAPPPGSPAPHRTP